MVGRVLRRWTAAAALAVAGLTLVLSGSPPATDTEGRAPSSDAKVSRPWAVLEQSIVTVRPQSPSVAGVERTSPRPISQRSAAVLAGVAASVAVAWAAFSTAFPGRPPLRRRRYSVARRAPPLLLLAQRP